MSIDYYDVLGLDVDADADAIKKAFKKLSLQTHPDKVLAQNGNKDDAGATSRAEQRFMEVKLARDILEDTERRKIYDTFGVDLGEERPEMEVWNIGLSTLLSPMGSFLLKTFLTRLVLWVVAFRWIAFLLIFLGFVTVALYAMDFKWGETQRIRDPEFVPVLVNIGVVDAVVALSFFWPLLGDTVVVLYLATEVAGVAIFLESYKIGAGAVCVAFVSAWLFQGRWLWILGIEAVLCVIMLAALTVSAGIVRLWIDGVHTQHADKTRDWRKRMRSERQRVQDEIAALKKAQR